MIEQKNVGHRQRLKQKFFSHPESLFDYELLEMLLFYVFSRKDTKSIAKALLQKFNNLHEVIFSDKQDLLQIPGLGIASVEFFALIKELMNRISFRPLKEESIISSNLHVIQYYRGLLSSEKKEQVRVMFINHNCRLIKEEQLQSGTVDQTAIYPREIIQKALDYGASSFILVHNHPSGEITPSKADIDVTKNLLSVAQQLNIQLLDHLIIGNDEVFSFVENHLI